MTEYLMVGEILKPQGIQGEVKVRPITADPLRFENAEKLFFCDEGSYTPVESRFMRFDGQAVYLKFRGINDRNTAETLRGKFLYIDRAHAIELNEDEYFIADLEGLKGVDDEGNELGILTEVMQPGGNDEYVFTDKTKKRELLVPALKSVILNTDIEAGIMLLSAARLREVAVENDI